MTRRPGINYSDCEEALGIAPTDIDRFRASIRSFVRDVRRKKGLPRLGAFQDHTTGLASDFLEQGGSGFFQPGRADRTLPKDRELILSWLSPYLKRVDAYELPTSATNSKGRTSSKKSKITGKRTRRASQDNEELHASKIICRSDVQPEDPDDTIEVVREQEFEYSDASRAPSEDAGFGLDAVEDHITTVRPVRNNSTNQRLLSDSQVHQPQVASGALTTDRTSHTESEQAGSRPRDIDSPQKHDRRAYRGSSSPRNFSPIIRGDRDTSYSNRSVKFRGDSEVTDRITSNHAGHIMENQGGKRSTSRHNLPPVATEISANYHNYFSADSKELYRVTGDQTAEVLRMTRAYHQSLLVDTTQDVERERNPDLLPKLNEQVQRLRVLIEKVDDALRERCKQ